MRRAAKADANQTEIVRWLRAAGASVQHLHMVGRGCPDILVGHRGRNWLLEIKDGRRPPSARRLTADEAAWHLAWRGQVAVVECAEDALRACGLDGRTRSPAVKPRGAPVAARTNEGTEK